MPKYKGKKSREKMIEDTKKMVERELEKAPMIGEYSLRLLKAMMPMREERGWILEKYEHPRPFTL